MNKNLTSQSGRSMIEIFGVLFFMGLLSMSCLYLYQYLIYRHRVSQTLNQISMAVTGAKTLDLEQVQSEGIKVIDDNMFIPVKYVISDVNFKADDEYHFITPLNAEIGVYRDPNNIWRVEIIYTDLMDYGDCRALLLSQIASEGIGYNGKIYTQKELNEDEDLLKKICEYYTSANIVS